MDRVITYVDGFNLYFGLRTKRWYRYYWLNIRELAQNLLLEHQELVKVKYFTSRVRDNPGKIKRQNTFIEALETLPDFGIYYGKYQVNMQQCPKCGFESRIPSEKMTDVNIATEMLVDAHKDLFDTAILVSADSDLTGPVRAIRELFPNKRVVAAFPPNRTSSDLKQAVHSHFTIGRRKFHTSQFPDTIEKPDGYTLQRPERWK